MGRLAQCLGRVFLLALVPNDPLEAQIGNQGTTIIIVPNAPFLPMPCHFGRAFSLSHTVYMDR